MEQIEAGVYKTRAQIKKALSDDPEELKDMDDAIASLDKKTASRIKDPNDPRSLVVHNDRGGHYRGGMWIEKLEGKGMTRSMSRKGKSGDNAACEGFFDRMKTEMYYGIRWKSGRSRGRHR